ncbi:hypothetical protein [Archangium sp.]|uniref:hypothetical protein n=1 Tax=Archangium sp. TaxID=1872627 RepID=UPI002EDB1CFD
MRLGLAVYVAITSGVLAACSAPTPSTLEFVDQSPLQPRLGEITTLNFRAIDSRGEPQPGVHVTFELQAPVPGVELNPTEADTNVGTGIVSTQVVAKGGRVSSVVVVARVVDKVAISPAVTFAGSSSNSRQFTFQCGTVAGEASGGVHAIGAFDESRHLIAGVKLRCIAHVADRNGDGIAGAQVSFLTEAGTIGPSSTSVTSVVGNAEVMYKTSLPLPEDVSPGTFTWNPPGSGRDISNPTYTGEYIAPLWMHPFAWVEDPIANFDREATFQEPRRPDPIRRDRDGSPLTNNPRDNLVSMIAVTTGEEAFDDLNNNGTREESEPFVDLTEPFVDNNDSGTWDKGERYVDANGNGVWDGKNGRYDATTLIWVQERILWTGWPHKEDREPATAQRNPKPVVKTLSPLPPVTLAKFKQVPVDFLMADPWFNSMARNGDDDGCNAVSVGPVEVAALARGKAFTYPAYTRLRYIIKDTRDPTDPTAPNYATPGIDFEVTADCIFTASPVEGYKAQVAAPKVNGVVFP